MVAPMNLPRTSRLEIEYCTQCRWLLRASRMAQELLTTFQDELGEEVALLPGTGGVFDVRLDGDVVWSPADDGRFPELKELKRRPNFQVDDLSGLPTEARSLAWPLSC
jgi:selenoprotein W-related protein